jgi:hypothetical protein
MVQTAANTVYRVGMQTTAVADQIVTTAGSSNGYRTHLE